MQPSTMAATTPGSKSHTTRNVILAIVAVFVLLVGGCTVAVVVSAGNAINDAVEDAANPRNTMKDDKAAESDKSTTPDDDSAGEMTVSQKNALESAKSYLAFSAFSEAGLIDQLSSKAGEGYPKADAIWAVKHLDVDWNAQAVKSAKSYLKFTSFSRSGLIDQLSSQAGEQFTKAQAIYAANQVGL